MFWEGKLIYRILKMMGKYSNDMIASKVRETQAYRSYLELWVHEVKTSIATAKLLIENNKNNVTLSLENELDKINRYVEQVLYYGKSDSIEKDYMIRPIHLKELIMGLVKREANELIAAGVRPVFGDLIFLSLRIRSGSILF